MITFKESLENKYAWIQFKIIDGEYFFEYLHKLIPESALYKEGGEYGRETEPHVTVLYGLDPNISIKEVRKTLSGAEIPKSVVGFGVSFFENDSKFDVAKMEIISPKSLWRLNELLNSLPTPGKTFPDYKPHITLAYTKKEWLREWMPPMFWGYPKRFSGYLEFCCNGVRERLNV